MASKYAMAENRLFATAKAVFGETFRFLPYAAAPGGGRREPDDNRSQRDVIGIYEAPNFKSTAFGGEARGSLPATMERQAVSIDEAEFASGQRPQRFDRLRRVATGELLEISQVELDAEGRLKCWAKSLGREQT